MPRRLLKKPEIRAMKDLFVENQDSAEMQDERWKIAFFEKLTHG